MAQRKRKRPESEPITALGTLWATTRFGMKVLFWNEVDIGTRGQSVQHWMVRRAHVEVIPAHVGHLEGERWRARSRGRGWGQRHHLARNPVQARVVAVLTADGGHELHADADAQERTAVPAHHLLQRLDHARQGVQPPAAIPEGFKLLRDGGTYVIAGHYTDAGPVEINPHVDINRKHADVRGHWGTEFRHMARALRMYAKHHEGLPFAKVIGGRYKIDDANQALEDVAALKVTKAIITP